MSKEEWEAEEDMKDAGCGKNLKTDLRRKDTLCCSKCSVGVNQIADGLK